MTLPVTRSSPQVWLVGKSEKEILGSGLPTNGAILKKFMFHHVEEGLTIAKSSKLAIDATVQIWMKARIPTQRVDSGVRKLRKLYDEYCSLKKHRLTPKDVCRFKEEQFKADLEELFDISCKDAMKIMSNGEDKQFLQMQQEDPSSASMAGIDQSLADKEARKRCRISMEAARKEKVQSQQTGYVLVPSTSIVQLDSDNSPSSSDSDDNFDIPSISSPTSTKFKKTIITNEVASALDRVNLPDRGAMFVVGAVAQALGVELDDVALSRSTIKCARMATRKSVATAHQASFSADVDYPLLLHWDGKLLPDINSNTKELVDRIAILVSGKQKEQLLAVPKIVRGTGEEQCNACLRTLEDWQLKPLIQGLVFDTTASNTGLKIGACTLLERALGKKLVWIACRHHVFEVMLASVFTAVLGPSNGPEIGLFKRFKGMWQSINKANFKSAPRLRHDMRSFLLEAMHAKLPRDDYKELLQLCHVFLGGGSIVSFRAPGAVHHARWMAKAIYSIKIYLFKDQVKLTAKEISGIQSIALFVSLVYARYWHEAPLAPRAPLNDRDLIILLHNYPDIKVRESAIKAFGRHLWYFSETLIALALFDDRVDNDTKVAMVANFSRAPNADAPKRLDLKKFDYRAPLQTYITSRSLKIFNLLGKNGREEAKNFLSKHPIHWASDTTFKTMQAQVETLKVVNDCAERGVALIQSFNSSLTKDETQKQFLLQLVSTHRKEFPIPTKAALTLH